MKKQLALEQCFDANHDVLVCLDLLIDYIIKHKISKTSVTTPFGEITIGNENWQLQIRLENYKFLSNNVIVEDFMTVYKEKRKTRKTKTI